MLLPADLTRRRDPSAKDRAVRLERLKLQHRADSLPSTLSGGEKQRVAVARALTDQPGVILADEPPGNLDSHAGQEVMMILHDIARDVGWAVLIVTHDPRVEPIADRIIWLSSPSPSVARRATSWRTILSAACRWTPGRHRPVSTGTARIFFCSTRYRERFEEDPERYAVKAVPY